MLFLTSALARSSIIGAMTALVIPPTRSASGEAVARRGIPGHVRPRLFRRVDIVESFSVLECRPALARRFHKRRWAHRYTDPDEDDDDQQDRRMRPGREEPGGDVQGDGQGVSTRLSRSAVRMRRGPPVFEVRRNTPSRRASPSMQPRAMTQADRQADDETTAPRGEGHGRPVPQRTHHADGGDDDERQRQQRPGSTGGTGEAGIRTSRPVITSSSRLKASMSRSRNHPSDAIR